MAVILIFGANAREIVLAKRMIEEKNEVYIMAEYFNPNEEEMKITHIHKYYDREYVRILKADLIFAFSDIYVHNEKFVENIYQDCKKACVVIPKACDLQMEKDKTFVRKIFSENCAVEVFSKKQLKEFVKKFKHVFLKIITPEKVICTDCNETDDMDLIDFERHRVFVDRFIEGKNITITIYHNAGNVLVFPTVADYPFIQKEKYGIKTGGVKCVYNNDDYKYKKQIERVVKKVLNKIDDRYVGFLSIQLLISDDNEFVVEFDVRPGEPEFINIIHAIREDINIGTLFIRNNGVLYLPSNHRQTLSVCVASEKYPEYDSINADLSLHKLLCSDGVKIYYSKAHLEGKNIMNYDGGRVLFAFFESDDKETVEQKSVQFKDNYLPILQRYGLQFYD